MQPRLYFRELGEKLCLWGAALGVVSVVAMVLLEGQWVLTILIPLQLVGFGLGMVAAPGEVQVGPETGWESAWMATPISRRVLWLAGLTVGIALGFGLLVMLGPSMGR